MKAVVLAGGRGTRMYPLTITTPKILIPIFNRPLIHNFVDILEGVVDEIIMVIGDVGKDKLQQKIIDYVELNDWPMRISFAVQEEPLGTGHAVQAAKDSVPKGETIIILNGDDLYSKKDIENLNKLDFGVVGLKVSDPEKWGILSEDNAGYLKEMIEKPEKFVGDIANIGMYKLNTDIFDLFEETKLSERGEYEFTDGVTLFAKRHKVKVIKSEGYWYPIGYPWQILDVHRDLSKNQVYEIKGEVEENVQVKGRLSLGKGSVIKSGTYIEGDVIIGENCQIGPNAHIRGTTVIGNDCKIGSSSVVKNATIMEGSKLPYFNCFPDGIMGKNVNFSVSCKALNLRHDQENIKTMIKGNLASTGKRKFSTVIGDNVRFGGNTIIYPGRKVWPNLTTIPSQIIDKDLTK